MAKMRTSKGNITAKARKASGTKVGKEYKFPIADERSALSAIKLRHNGKGISASAVLAKASRWANANNNERVKKAVMAAREADKKRSGKK